MPTTSKVKKSKTTALVPRRPGLRPRKQEVEAVEEPPEDVTFSGEEDDVVEKISAFVARALSKPYQEIVLELRQEGMGSSLPVQQWSRSDMLEQDPESIATGIFDRAVEYTEEATSGNVVRFMIWAMNGNSGKPYATHPFSVFPQNPENAFGSEDGHTPGGHMVQALRHNEIITRLAYGMIIDTQRNLREENRDLRAQGRLYAQQQVLLMQTHQQLMDRSMMRDLYMKKQLRRERHMETVVNYAMQFIPDLAARAGFVPGGTKDLEQLNEMLAQMDESQIDLFARKIPSDKPREALMRLWRSARARAQVAARDQHKKLTSGEGHLETRMETGEAARKAAAVLLPKAVETEKATQAAPEAAAISRLDSTVLFIVGELARVEDAVFTLLLGKVDEDARIEFTAARETAKKIRAEGRAGLTPEEAAAILKVKPHALGLIGVLEEATFETFLGQLDKGGHEDLRWLRGVVRAAASAGK